MSALSDKAMNQELDERQRDAAMKGFVEKAAEQMEGVKRRSLDSGKVDETYH